MPERLMLVFDQCCLDLLLNFYLLAVRRENCSWLWITNYRHL